MAYSKQVRARNRSARAFLQKEFGLAKHYKAMIEDASITMLPEDRAYKCRVVAAAQRTINCMPLEKQKFIRAALVDVHKSAEAISADLNIAVGTYYNWRKEVLQIFGRFLGVL